MRLIPLAVAGLALLVAFAAPQSPAAAQGSFSPVVTVNGRAITGYELDQRARFLALIGAPGDPLAEAEKALIEDRIRQDAAKRAGIAVTAEQVKAGMEEFASRANLSAEEFLKAIAGGGIEPETFRDFVSAGILWREVVRAKFAGRVIVSDAEVDRALSVEQGRGKGPRVLVSELIIPAPAANLTEARDRAVKIAEGIRSEADFARAVAANSAAPSRTDGGRLGWMPLTNLPAAARGVVVTLRPGQITPPVPIGNGIALFLLRGLEQGSEEIAPSAITVDYALFTLSGEEEAQRVRDGSDTCNDLYGFARGLPADRVVRQTQRQAQLPGDIAGALAPLDEGETATLRRGGATVLLMLCGRSATAAEGTLPPGETPAVEDASAPLAPGIDGQDPPPRLNPELGFAAGPSRDLTRTELVNQRLGGLADGYLEELKADAVITRP